MHLRHLTPILFLSLSSLLIGQRSDPPLNAEIQSLGADFFAWRMITQPATHDDIPRLDRPVGWLPDYSPTALADQRAKQTQFRQRLNQLSIVGWSVRDSVDFLLLRSAVERVNWELNILRTPHRNPDFYMHQTLGVMFELLLLGTPITPERMAELLLRIESFPKTIADAKANLTDPIAPFAHIALEKLEIAPKALDDTHKALKRHIPRKDRKRFDAAFKKAKTALNDYEAWINSRLDKMTHETAIGEEHYLYFLKNIALLPFSPRELLQMGQIETNRSIAFEAYEAQRQMGTPEAKLFPNMKAQIAQGEIDEADIRAFLEDNDIMTVPNWLQHYVNRPAPAYFKPLSFMGVADDLTSEHRLDEPGVRYIGPPSPDLGFFARSMAEDPRGIIVHEGVPGHYYQLARSWRNVDPIRRHFFDSGPNEGIGFYVEELLLQFGMFDDRPRTRQIIYRYMRLRALRVEVDIQLALGNFSTETAGTYLAQTVPMDEKTAREEAGFFAYNPGQAISYQIGKLQIEQFLTDARLIEGDPFDLRAFHDYLMVNGNVPIALLRWERLGLSDEIGKLW